MANNKPLKIVGTLWLGKDEQNLLSDKRIALLEKIDESGSITQAAKAAGLSYKGAWDAVDAMNNMFGEPLVATSTGGKGGGGTRLTLAGVRIVDACKTLQREQQRFLKLASEGIEDFEQIYQMVRRLSMKTSARNQFFGKVSAIKQGPVNVEVELTLTGGDKLYAVITHDGLEGLNLGIGSEAWALVKASWVILAMPQAASQLSARNQLAGKVSRITRGGVNAEVTLQTAGGVVISATLTNDSVDSLRITEGSELCAVFKASSVILGISD